MNKLNTSIIKISAQANKKLTNIIHTNPNIVGFNLSAKKEKINSGYYIKYNFKPTNNFKKETFNDKIIDFNNYKIKIDALSMTYIKGLYIDRQTNIMSSKFVFYNSNNKYNK